MRVLKYQLNPGLNTLKHLGTALKLVYLDYQDTKLMGWFTATDDYEADEHDYDVYIALTGERISNDYRYVTSTQLKEGGGYFVVHAFD